MKTSTVSVMSLVRRVAVETTWVVIVMVMGIALVADIMILAGPTPFLWWVFVKQ